MQSPSPSSDPAGGAPRTHSFAHVPELDGVRGIAALMVFFHHAGFTSVQPGPWGTITDSLMWLFHFGSYGVDLFFVLSGYLISSLLMKDQTNPAYYHDFYWKRVLRIMPLYAVCLVSCLIFFPGSGKSVLLSTLFVANFTTVFHIAMPPGPFWSLSIEEQFYALWPTVVRRRTVAQIERLSLVVIAACTLLRFAGAVFAHHNNYLTFFRCDGLAAGAFLACWFERSRLAGAEARASRSRQQIRYGLGALLVGALLIFASSPLAGTDRARAFHDAFTQTGLTFFCGGLIALLVAQSGRAWLAVFRSRVLVFFGLISYAFYMLHEWVMELFDHFHGPVPDGVAAAYWLRLSIILLASIAVALVSRYLIELPAMSLRRFVLAKPAPKAQVQAHLLAVEE